VVCRGRVSRKACRRPSPCLDARLNETTTGIAGGERRRRLGALLLIVVVAATFANAIDNEFVYDDQLVIVDDPAVRLPLSAGFEGLRYRPLRTLSYRLDYALGGMNPRVFHVANVVYHAAAALFVQALLGTLGASAPGALAGALLFAVHPVQVDAVSYAAGRRDVLCGLFYALGVVAYLRHRRSGMRAPLALAAVAYVLAVLAKEMAITMPVAAVLADRWSQVRRPAARSPGRGMVYLLVFAAAGLLALAFTYGGHILHLASDRPWHGGSAAANFGTVARVWVKYLQLLVWPATLSVDYSYDAFPVSTSVADPRALASLTLIVGLAVAGWASWRRGGFVGLGLAWIAVTLLPVSQLVPFRELLAEHYLYVPMIGAAAIFAGVVDDARRRWPTRRRLLAASVAVVVVAAAGRTVVRNRDWRDRLTLWSATVAVVPRCARAQFNLGQAYFERSRLADAERAWLAAAALQPDDRETARSLAKLYYRLGNYDLAARHVDVVLAGHGDDGEALTLAGWIALDRGMSARAAEYFSQALAVLPPERAEGARRGQERAARLRNR
jgi:protein O-mannosyl-transferase